jgi:hypothetical protein
MRARALSTRACEAPALALLTYSCSLRDRSEGLKDRSAPQLMELLAPLGYGDFDDDLQ